MRKTTITVAAFMAVAAASYAAVTPPNAGYEFTIAKGKKEASYLEYSGFCFETQGYPDAINHPEFPSNVLKANEKYKQTTKFAFSVI